MSYNFRPLQRDQMYLMPPALQDWLPENDLSWFILDAVSQMDLEEFYQKYRPDGWGNAAFEPTMMVGLLLYAFCLGERSSRRIEWLCERDIGFRIVTANQIPDHTTIARFRQQHEEELNGLFTQVLLLCAQAGLVKVGVVALDGTKMKANASLSANRTYASIEEEVKRMLAEAQKTDEEEDQRYGPGCRGDELPDDLRDRASRLARLKACKERLEQEASYAAEVQSARLDARSAQEAESGKKLRGRKPKAPPEAHEMVSKANLTDPDSRVMKTRTGYVQGYNAQAVVTENQIIIAAELTQEANDVHQLHPMLDLAQRNLEAIGSKERIGVALADAGYWSQANMEQAEAEGPELLVATTKDWKQRKALRDGPSPRGRIPSGLSFRERMERKLLTRRGRELYKKRGKTVEPVFGQVKDARGCDGFMRRGRNACDSEWKLLSAAHNLLKLWRSIVKAVEKACRLACISGKVRYEGVA